MSKPPVACSSSKYSSMYLRRQAANLREGSASPLPAMLTGWRPHSESSAASAPASSSEASASLDLGVCVQITNCKVADLQIIMLHCGLQGVPCHREEGPTSAGTAVQARSCVLGTAHAECICYCEPLRMSYHRITKHMADEFRTRLHLRSTDNLPDVDAEDMAGF